MSCPIDHNNNKSPDLDQSNCPVDYTARATWSKVSSDTLLLARPQSSTRNGQMVPAPPETLSTSREVSSIPRSDNEKWVYPSEAQFYAAMVRKNHDPKAPDMRVVVPIHNAVNERAWSHIKEWEAGRGGERCGGVRLLSFKGKPGEPSPKARILTLLGYNPPFDRHDWVVDRCGTRIRYVIDFYAGRPLPGTSNVSFFLDVRPALDTWEAVGMRTSMLVNKFTRAIRETFSGSSSIPPASAKPDS
ncbi:cytochrome c and c1 heme-lyase [Multifurca ochricompacta]|uniref:Holocytochrome c-type synthase n=1 Tax=Multifurca ochricompacta TaxID=376703 RepID=A0AAD4MCV4_9AGAM|nr:cytochrome c and c1 heme-lyase [Multifurca ochricompacta]